jgi:Homeodomain-like domain
MARSRAPILLEEAEWRELERRVAARTGSQQAARRAQIILRAAAGEADARSAAALGVAERTVWAWRQRFVRQRLAGLEDRPHCPPPRRYPAEIQAKLRVLACQRPADLGWEGQTHWTIADLARSVAEHPALGLGAPSKSTLGVLLKRHKLRLDRL